MSTETPQGFDQWLASVKSGDTPVSQELVKTCRDYLLLVADQNLDPALHAKFGASDLVQETFLHAQRKFAQFRGESERELLAWLKQILLNHLIDERRKYRNTEKRMVTRERRLPEVPVIGPVTALHAGERSPRAEAIAQEQLRSLTQALERLPPDYREVLMLRNWDRLSFKEIGERMRRTPEAVRKLWTRAIERLQRELDGEDESGSRT